VFVGSTPFANNLRFSVLESIVVAKGHYSFAQFSLREKSEASEFMRLLMPAAVTAMNVVGACAMCTHKVPFALHCERMVNLTH
jgi:hypothetical protein